MQSQPIHFHPSTQETPKLLLPVKASVFAERAERFATLAQGHSLEAWLGFLARLSRAQHEVLAALPELPLPDAAAIELSLEHGMPPLDPAAPPSVWREVLRQLVARLADAVPAAGHAALEQLGAADEAQLDRLAALLLDGEAGPEEAAQLPFVAAALQVVYTGQAAQLDASRLRPLSETRVCPCCGSPAVASIVRLGAEINKLRYLHCSLCNSEWNLARATCSSCGSDAGVSLQQIEGGNGAVHAETCDSCKSYLKIVYQDKDPRVDPVADDLATLALDILVDESGYSRAGPNLLLIGAQG
jgi:FdhE protein